MLCLSLRPCAQQRGLAGRGPPDGTLVPSGALVLFRTPRAAAPERHGAWFSGHLIRVLVP